MSLAQTSAHPAFLIVLFYIAISFFFVAVVYFQDKSAFLGKRHDGGRRPLAWLFFAPYFVLNTVLWWLARYINRAEPAVHVVQDSVWLGRRLSGIEVHHMTQGMNPSCVIDLAAEFTEARAFRSVTCYQSLPVLDGLSASQDQLHHAVNLIDRFKNQGVMVHCALGHGRSAQVICAYLLFTGTAQNPDQAISQIAKIRPGVGLNKAQKAGLETFQKSLTA